LISGYFLCVPLLDTLGWIEIGDLDMGMALVTVISLGIIFGSSGFVAFFLS
jgi:type IV secretory pathway VirB2 component (pilin)